MELELLLLGAVFHVLWTFGIHSNVKKCDQNEFPKNILYIFTLDLFFARKYKPTRNKLNLGSRQKKTNYIKLMNSLNIAMVLIIFFMFLFFSTNYPKELLNPLKFIVFLIVFSGICIYRTGIISCIKSMNKLSIFMTIIIITFFISFNWIITNDRILNFFMFCFFDTISFMFGFPVFLFMLLKILIGFIGYRCISRSLELIISFYEDAISVNKESDLTSSDRVLLAIKSYVEVILNYSIFYHLISMFNKLNFKKEEIYNIFDIAHKNLSLTDFTLIPVQLNILSSLFKSIGISTFSGIGTSHLGIFSSIHIFTSFVLVVFAIAVYLANIGEK